MLHLDKVWLSDWVSDWVTEWVTAWELEMLTHLKINTYTGVTRNTFKKRYYGHTYSFNHRGENSTTLSSHLWNLKDQNKNYEISWNIVDRAQEFNPVNRKCRLCLKEKFYIIFQPDGATLNLRSELFTTCRHRLRLLLQKMYNTWGISFWYISLYYLTHLSL